MSVRPQPLRRRVLNVLACGSFCAAVCGLDGATSTAAASGPRRYHHWTLQEATSTTYWLQLLVSDGGSTWSSGRTVPTARVEGLGPDGLRTPHKNVTLRLRREAGTIVATGQIRRRRGEGSFEVELDPAFAVALERRGVGRPTEEQHAHLLYADATLTLLDEFERAGYPMPDVVLLTRAADHGVDEWFVRGLADAGYRLGDIESLIEACDHGVDPPYIHAMAEAGHTNVPMRQLLRARDHGVDPHFMADLRAAGLPEMALDELIRLRDHGVDGPFIRELAAEGLVGLDAEELLQARDHGVDGAYLAGMREAGYANLSLRQAVRARDHGVDGRFARRYQRREGRSVSLEELIRARDAGD